VEKNNFAPVDLLLHERIEKFELRRTCGCDHVSRVPLIDRLPDDIRSVFSSGSPQIFLCIENS
jgi:hypothetical protein